MKHIAAELKQHVNNQPLGALTYSNESIDTDDINQVIDSMVEAELALESIEFHAVSQEGFVEALKNIKDATATAFKSTSKNLNGQVDRAEKLKTKVKNLDTSGMISAKSQLSFMLPSGMTADQLLEQWEHVNLTLDACIEHTKVAVEAGVYIVDKIDFSDLMDKVILLGGAAIQTTIGGLRTKDLKPFFDKFGKSASMLMKSPLHKLMTEKYDFTMSGRRSASPLLTNNRSIYYTDSGTSVMGERVGMFNVGVANKQTLSNVTEMQSLDKETCMEIIDTIIEAQNKLKEFQEQINHLTSKGLGPLMAFSDKTLLDLILSSAFDNFKDKKAVGNYLQFILGTAQQPSLKMMNLYNRIASNMLDIVEKSTKVR